MIHPGEIYMHSDKRLALEAAAIAIVITTTMDAVGFSMFSALPLMGLMVVYFFRGKLNRQALSFVVGHVREYAVSLFLPILVIATIVLIAWNIGAVNETGADWQKSRFNILMMASTGILMAAITEEGFFRGVLWGLLERSGSSRAETLLWTTIAFTLWHLSAILLDTGFNPPVSQVPVLILNVGLLGYIWGGSRLLSGSIWAPAIYHSVWNALAYDLFGFGEKTGTLGIEETWLWGPEVGLIGLAANTLVAGFFFIRIRRLTSD